MQLTELLTRVFDDIPSVPQALALRALSDALREFCRRTYAWREPLEDTPIPAGEPLIDLSIGQGTNIIAVPELRLDGAKIDPAAPEEVQQLRRRPREGDPIGFVHYPTGQLELLPSPKRDHVLSGTIVVAPTLGATNLNMPNHIGNEYGDALAAGAKMRLVKMPAQPWSAPDMMQLYASEFYMAVSEAKLRAATSMGDAPLQVQMRDWV